MSIDFSKPVKTDNYDTGLLASIRAHVVSLATWLDPSYAGTLTNTPTGARRLNGGALQMYNGSSWVADPINGVNLSGGNVGIGTASPGQKLDVVASTSTEVFARVGNGTQQVGVGVSSSNYPQMGTRSNHELQIITNNSWKLSVTTDGRLYGLYLHNNAGSVSGSTEQYIASGTFTPSSLTSAGYSHINFTSFSGQRGQWMRVGNVVTVSGQLTGSVTTINNDVFAGMGIPIPSGSTLGVGNIQGVAVFVFSAHTQAAFVQDVSYTSPKGVEFAIRNCGASGSCTVFFHFSYVIG
jgi:hypothetical protein